jgi:hypothetical protein
MENANNKPCFIDIIHYNRGITVYDYYIIQITEMLLGCDNFYDCLCLHSLFAGSAGNTQGKLLDAKEDKVWGKRLP